MPTLWDVDPRQREIAETVLTPKQLDVWRLRLAKASWREISFALGVSTTTVRDHHARALMKLAEHPEFR